MAEVDRHMTTWPHAPTHWFEEEGTYMVTAGTYRKELLFGAPERRTMLHDALLSAAVEAGWQLLAWAVFGNHYHFVGHAKKDAQDFSNWLRKLHMNTAKALNRLDGIPGRKVWYQFRDTKLTFERSFLARLAYVHNNPVNHGFVPVASSYRWCSASWLERTASPAFYKTVMNTKTDRVNVPDDF